MKKSSLSILIISLFIFGFIFPQDLEYVGTHKCQTCHKSNKKGAQYKVWAESKHAKAFDALLSDKAIAIGKEKKLALPPSESPECLECHTVGYGEGGYEVKEASFWNPAPEDKSAVKAMERMEGLKNVGCEMCHGAGNDYKKKKIMEGIYAGELKAEDFGLVKKTPEETCLKCHNKRSPSFKAFNYDERVKEIAHPFPEGM
jgi:hypothetical protein